MFMYACAKGLKKQSLLSNSVFEDVIKHARWWRLAHFPGDPLFVLSRPPDTPGGYYALSALFPVVWDFLSFIRAGCRCKLVNHTKHMRHFNILLFTAAVLCR